MIELIFHAQMLLLNSNERKQARKEKTKNKKWFDKNNKEQY